MFQKAWDEATAATAEMPPALAARTLLESDVFRKIPAGAPCYNVSQMTEMIRITSSIGFRSGRPSSRR
jgi:hypothetical protein